MSRIQTIFFLFAFFIAAGVAGRMDYEEALVQEAAYCADLKDHVHGDYLDIKEVCAARYWSK